jgi:hypothetical protein
MIERFGDWYCTMGRRHFWIGLHDEGIVGPCRVQSSQGHFGAVRSDASLKAARCPDRSKGIADTIVQ